jgi:hypothetical protein
MVQAGLTAKSRGPKMNRFGLRREHTWISFGSTGGRLTNFLGRLKPSACGAKPSFLIYHT